MGTSEAPRLRTGYRLGAVILTFGPEDGGPDDVVEVRLDARPDRGAFYEEGTGGCRGAWYCPMRTDGTPDLDALGRVEVDYEDA